VPGNIDPLLLFLWHAVAQLVEASRNNPEGSGFDSRPQYGPGVDSAYNRNEYKEYFLGVKAAGA